MISDELFTIEEIKEILKSSRIGVMERDAFIDHNMDHPELSYIF